MVFIVIRIAVDFKQWAASRSCPGRMREFVICAKLGGSKSPWGFGGAAEHEEDTLKWVLVDGCKYTEIKK
jgi:hypothetical protein